MKKLLFMMVVGFGGAMLVKGNYVTISPDHQVRVAGWAVPLPQSVQTSPIMGMVSTMLQGDLGPTATAGRSGTARQSALPNVTSAVSTYNGNAPSAGGGQSDQLNNVSRALR